MLRAALPLSVALAVLCGDGAALGARTTTTVAGEVRAVAFAGNAISVAHLPPRGGLTVDRIVAGAAAQQLLGTSLRGNTDQVQLAGSERALAVSLQPETGDGFPASRVFVGPAAGPLREVASCAAGLLAAPVAVAGERIAWREGGCGDPPAGPTAIDPASIMIGAADAAVAPTRLALDPAVLPASLVLTSTGGLVGTLRPSFFAVDSEVRGFSLHAAGATLLSERSAIVSPIGVSTDRTRAFSRAGLSDGDGEQDRARGCTTSLFTIAAGAGERRELPLGGCLAGADAPAGPSAARVAGDRVFALVSVSRNGGDDLPRTSLISLRADGSDRRVHAAGSYRPPQGLAADGDRVAYWHRRCSDADGDIVVVDGAAQDSARTSIASCTARVLTRSARVRDGRISLRVRCPAGCRGVVVEHGGEIPRSLRSFALRAGTHALPLRVSAASRRRGRLRLELAVESGPPRLAQIRLRR